MAMMASILDTFPFGIFVVSVLSTKLLHLFTHFTSVPLLSFIFYLPSFLITDLVFISVARVLLRRTSILSAIGYAFGVALSFITLGAASSQLGFYSETGGEISWEDAGAFADKEGLKVLMDGAKTVGLSMLGVIVVAWCLKGILYRTVGDFLNAVGSWVVSVSSCIRRRSSRKFSDLEEGDDASTVHSERDTISDIDAHESQRFLGHDVEKPQEPLIAPKKPRGGFTVLAILSTLYFLVVAVTRPEKPYNHLTSTLPWPLLDVYHSAADTCAEKILLSQNQWPLPELISKTYWKKASGHFKGWAPGAVSKTSIQYQDYHPGWLPNPAPTGFDRWDPKQAQEQNFVVKPGQDENKESNADDDTCAVNITEHKFYSPVLDPMRITNLDSDVLAPLQEVFKDNSVKIKHVVYILMESMREELFPLQHGSDIHKMILNTQEDEEQRELINERTMHLTPNAERITGKSGNFFDENGKLVEPEETSWTDQTRPGFGGINVVGAYTPSSVSTKSLAAGHCGVWPLPVDKFEESGLKAYQPCLPQILELFNVGKDENSTSEDFREHEWAPAFFQATTDHYDRQYVFDEYMGFKNVVTKRILADKRLGPQDIEEIHYFGYPESVLRPYLHEYINQTLSQNKRMFLSHFTSTTHHPWVTPKEFETERYLSLKDGKWHNDMNKYLNTVRYCDAWLGELLQMLDDYGVSNETLVVFVGDHGQAFKEDTKKSGTYENGHISNYRVPITLRHPNLPRVQYNANATSLSLLPTILDLLINTKSLNGKDKSIAADLIQDYEGQSLIRPYKTNEDGRRAWNFGLVNAGGGMLCVSSADAPWRLVMPLTLETAYTVTDVMSDPLELHPISEWTVDALGRKVESKMGAEASVWAREAEAVARWWVVERKRLWGYKKT